MKNFTKTLGAAAAAVALTVGSATPAFADDRRGRDDGISLGDVIAGAVIIGGLAAILTSDDDNDRYYEGSQGYGYDGGYDRHDNRRNNDRRGGNGRRAVEQCVAAVEQRAGQGYGYANVTEIRDVERTRNGLRVKGRLQVQQSYGRHGNTDNGKFTCQIQNGRVVGLDISGIDQRQYRGNNGGYYQGGQQGGYYGGGRGW
jgi:hypothetical protein